MRKKIVLFLVLQVLQLEEVAQLILLLLVLQLVLLLLLQLEEIDYFCFRLHDKPPCRVHVPRHEIISANINLQTLEHLTGIGGTLLIVQQTDTINGTRKQREEENAANDRTLITIPNSTNILPPKELENDETFSIL